MDDPESHILCHTTINLKCVVIGPDTYSPYTISGDIWFSINKCVIKFCSQAKVRYLMFKKKKNHRWGLLCWRRVYIA